MTFRARLIAAVIVLVAVTAAFMGVFSYLLVRTSLRNQLVENAIARSEFNISVLATEARLARDAGPSVFETSGIGSQFLIGGAEGFYVEFADGGRSASSLSLLATGDALSDELREIVERGDFGYQFLTIDGEPALVVGASRLPDGPDFYFLFPARAAAETLSQLRRILVTAGVAVIVIGTIAAGLIARRVLRPVGEAGNAAERMAAGDLSARLPFESNDEIGRWAQAFNRMASSLQHEVDQLVAAQERERRFVADVSHELRTPLTALVNEASILRDHLDEMPESMRHVSAMMIDDIARLRRLVDDLLEMSRLDAQPPIERSYADLEALIAATITERHPDARLEAPNIDGLYSIDRRALERIIGNLLDNARVHAPGAPTVVVAGVDAGDLHIAVSDEGPGIADVDLDRVFDRFYKADPARQGGSGLGLGIARQHARRLGGDVSVRNRSPHGLVAEVTVPVTEPLHIGDPDAILPLDPEEKGGRHEEELEE